MEKTNKLFDIKKFGFKPIDNTEKSKFYSLAVQDTKITDEIDENKPWVSYMVQVDKFDNTCHLKMLIPTPDRREEVWDIYRGYIPDNMFAFQMFSNLEFPIPFELPESDYVSRAEKRRAERTEKKNKEIFTKIETSSLIPPEIKDVISKGLTPEK